MRETFSHNHAVDATPQERMQALIELISAYIEQYHGGSVEMVGYDGEILTVKMGGACDGCELSEGTLRGWVEGSVRQFFPDLVRIDAV